MHSENSDCLMCLKLSTCSFSIRYHICRSLPLEFAKIISFCFPLIRSILLYRSFPYSAYRQFTWWAHGHLGKIIRSVIPSFVVINIRSAFPSEDGNYTEYIVGDDDESTFESELEQAWKDFLNVRF